MTRKILSMILCLCLLAALLPAAMAESWNEYARLEGDRYTFLSASNLLVLDNALYTPDGKELVSFKENVSFQDYYNAIVVTNWSTGLEGLLTLDGNLVIPMEYDSVRTEDCFALAFHFADAEESDYDVRQIYFSSGDVAFKKYDTIELFNIQTGKLLTTLTRDELETWSTEAGHINLMARDGSIRGYDSDFQPVDAEIVYDSDFSYLPGHLDSFYDDETFLYGVKDDAGKIIIEPEYEYIYVGYASNNQYFEFESEDSLLGLLDVNGEVVVPAQFESMDVVRLQDGTYVYGVGGVFCGQGDETMVLYNSATGESHEVPNPDYDVDFAGNALCGKDEEGYFILNADGKMTRLSADCTYLDYVVYPNGAYFIAEREDGDIYDLVDVNGNLLMTAENIICSSAGYLSATNEGETVMYTLK